MTCKLKKPNKSRRNKKIQIREDTYPPAKHRPRARRSSKVVGSIDVRSEADKPAAPSPPKVPKN